MLRLDGGIRLRSCGRPFRTYSSFLRSSFHVGLLHQPLCPSCSRGFDRDETASFCIPYLQASDFTTDEAIKTLISEYQRNISDNSTRPATEKDIKAKKDTGTISGEEVREKTLFLTESLVDYLSPPLGVAFGFYNDRREHGMVLLSTCIVRRHLSPLKPR